MSNFWVRGKTVMIVGAASVLGKSLSYNLIEQYNCNILAVDYDETKLLELKEKLDHSEKYETFGFNLSVEKNWSNFALKLGENNKKIDILINLCVNLPKFNQFDKFSQKEITRILNENFYTSIFSIRYFLPFLKKGRASGIVNVTYEPKNILGIGTSIFSSSMSALKSYTNILAEELDKKIYVGLVIVGRANLNLYENQDEKIKKEFSTGGQNVNTLAKKIISGISIKKSNMLIGTYANISSFANRLFPKSIRCIKRYLKNKKNIKYYKEDFDFVD